MDFDTREIRKMEMKDRKIKEKPKKKKSKVATAIIVLLFLTNIALLSYIVYDKELYKEVISYFEKNPTTEKEKIEKLSLQDEEVNTLYSYLTPIKEKLVMHSSMSKQDLTEEEAKALSLSLLKEEDFERENGGLEEQTYQLKSVLLEEAAEKILGRDYQLKKEDMKTPVYQNYSNALKGNITMSYQETCNCYLVKIAEKEEKEVEPFYTKLTKAIKKENRLIITEKVIYTLEEEGKVKIYSDWALSRLLKESSTAIEINDYLDQGIEINYVFEKKGENYQFLSSEINEKS